MVLSVVSDLTASRSARGRAVVLCLTLVLLALALVVWRTSSADGPGGEEDPAESYLPRISEELLERIEQPVADEVELGAFPGAALAVGIGAEEMYLREFGAIGWTRNAAPVSALETQYDLASLTKVVATASAVLLLVDDGRLRLDDPVSMYLDGFDRPPKSAITIRHLLTHTSGLPAGAILLGDSRAERIARARSFDIYPPAGARVVYSDVGFVLLWEAAEAAAGEPLTAYLERKLYAPLGMHATRFSPGLDCETCAPTGRLQDQSLYRGRPFDPLAQRLDGVGGNAGLFSTAGDLARFMAMVANGGELDGVRVLSVEAVEEFTSEQPVGGGGRFRLGWELFCDTGPEAETAGDGCGSGSMIGHTGWTGPSIHLDPRTGLWVVLLTNRTYEPRAPNRIQSVRREVLSRAAAAANGDPTAAPLAPTPDGT